MLKMEEDQLQDHKHGLSDPGHAHGYVDKYTSPPANGHLGPFGEDPWDQAWDIPHSSTSGRSSTGITVAGVSASYRHGQETRPKNMNVIWIMKIW